MRDEPHRTSPIDRARAWGIGLCSASKRVQDSPMSREAILVVALSAVGISLGCGARTGLEDGGQDPAGGGGGDLPAKRCGNLLVESGEACDDGNVDDTDACLSTCVKARCGDGI